MAEFYVYALFTPWDGQPCYIGKGRGNRMFEHARMAERHQNVLLREALVMADRFGAPLIAVKVRSGISEAEALGTEVALIKAIGRKVVGGPLLNMTDGGEGISNPSPEFRETLGAAQRRRFASEEAREAAAEKTKAAWADPEKRQRMLEARTYKVTLSAEQREQRSLRARALKHSPEARAKISASLKGHVPSSETRAIWKAQRRLRKQRRSEDTGRYLPSCDQCGGSDGSLITP